MFFDIQPQYFQGIHGFLYWKIYGRVLMAIGYHTRAAVAGCPYRYFASLLELATWADCLVAAAPGGAGTRLWSAKLSLPSPSRRCEVLERAGDLVQIKGLWIKLAIDPCHHLLMLGVLRILDSVQKARITSDATTSSDGQARLTVRHTG
jgi:hypothetical protein